MQRCGCGMELPVHLITEDEPPAVRDLFSHVCVCERKWKVNEQNRFVCVGTEANPFGSFADYSTCTADQPNTAADCHEETEDLGGDRFKCKSCGLEWEA